MYPSGLACTSYIANGIVGMHAKRLATAEGFLPQFSQQQFHFAFDMHCRVVGRGGGAVGGWARM